MILESLKRRWIKRSENWEGNSLDPYERGLVSLYLGNYSMAGAQLWQCSILQAAELKGATEKQVKSGVSINVDLMNIEIGREPHRQPKVRGAPLPRPRRPT